MACMSKSRGNRSENYLGLKDMGGGGAAGVRPYIHSPPKAYRGYRINILHAFRFDQNRKVTPLLRAVTKSNVRSEPGGI